MVDEFPDVRDEPTSYLYKYAEGDDNSPYSLVECRECGGDAVKVEGGGVSTYVCRGCRVGKRDLQAKANYGPNWKAVREWVLRRDGFHCRECGGGGELHVHHRKKLVWFESIQDANTPENLVTLCKDCHND